jgi:hypothetical protein
MTSGAFRAECGNPLGSHFAPLVSFMIFHLGHSFDPAAENACEGLLNAALQTDPGNAEALQSLASVRMSQQRPEDAKTCLEQAWLHWKDLEAGRSLCFPFLSIHTTLD